MIIRRILLTGIVMQCLWLVAGCCYDVTEVFFQWTGMRVENLDNSGAEPLPANDDGIPAAAYGIRLHMTSRSLSGTSHPPFSVAFATTCPEVFEVNRDTVRSFRIERIITVSTGDSTTDVTGDFVVRSPWGAQSLGQFTPATEFFHSSNVYSSGRVESFELFLVKNTVKAGRARFVVTMELSNDTMLTDTTDAIALF
jgi:hypothetical protein